jgi:ElaB/YqjD/DUF883 family membrane-anchored ribosome-binding protein
MDRRDDIPGGTGMGGSGMGGSGMGGPGTGGTGMGGADAEVHARISSRPAGTQGAMDQAQDALGRTRDRAEGMVEDAKERASELAERARQGVGNAVDRAEDALEERTGALSFIRENPLPAVGIAFAAGFLLAGSGSDKRSRRGIGGRVRNQVRGAVIGAVSAAFARELRNLTGIDGEGGGLLGELLGGGSERSERPRRSTATAAGSGYGRGSTSGLGGM